MVKWRNGGIIKGEIADIIIFANGAQHVLSRKVSEESLGRDEKLRQTCNITSNCQLQLSIIIIITIIIIIIKTIPIYNALISKKLINSAFHLKKVKKYIIKGILKYMK